MEISRVKNSFSKAGLLLFIVLMLLLVHTIGISRLTPEGIRNLILSFGSLGPIVYIILYALRPLFLFPALILTLAGGLAFGPWWGTIYVLIGGSLGAYLCFALARLLGRRQVEKIWGKSLYFKEFEQRADTYGFRTIFTMRVVPLFPYDPVSFAAGLTSIRFCHYAAATTLGMMPGAAAIIFLGHSLTDILSPTFYLALALVFIVLATPLVYHYVKK